MPATVVRRPQTFTAGPWKGVRNTTDPFDDGAEYLVDAQNCYLPDPISGSGMYARPGFAVANPSTPLAGAGQGCCTHVMLSGSVYNFIAAGGKLYRTDAALATFTDVSPVGITISTSATRIYFTSFADQLIISDGVNPPWIGTNLGATPVTGTKINYDGAGTAWSAFGQPQVYAGSLVFILNAVGGIARRTDIVWSIAGDPTTGYQQTNYDYNWTLEQTGTSPLYALAATNIALYYFRDKSIGALVGTPGPDFRTASTHDAIAVNVGTLQSATIAQYGTTIFFCDQIGRPHMLPMGGRPIPIWLNMRAVVDASTSGYPSATAQVACATIEPTLNIYLAAIWSPVGSLALPPTELAAFDARSGAYLGQWSIGVGTSVEAIGVLNDTVGRGSLTVIGSKVLGPATGGYVWTQNAVIGGGMPLLSEGGAFLLSEGSDSLTTENTVPSWLDDGQVPVISATTPRLGYSEDSVLNFDRCTVVAGTNSPCAVSVTTPNAANVLEGTPSPTPSADGMYRMVAGLELQGRGAQVRVRPTTATGQWNLQRVAVTAVPSQAGPEDA